MFYKFPQKCRRTLTVHRMFPFCKNNIICSFFINIAGLLTDYVLKWRYEFGKKHFSGSASFELIILSLLNV